MKSFIALAVICMVSMAQAGVILGGPSLSAVPLTTSSLVSPLSLHHTRVVSAPLTTGLVSSPSWVNSPLLTRTVSTHGVWGSPWSGSSALLAQPTLVRGGLVGGHTVW